MKDQRALNYVYVISGMSFRGRTNQFRLFVRSKGQENECSAHIRERIAGLSNTGNGRPRFWPVSATRRKRRLNTKHPTAERSRSHKIALYVRMRPAIDVFIARPYSGHARMDVYSCSPKEVMVSRPLLRGQLQCKTKAALRGI